MMQDANEQVYGFFSTSLNIQLLKEYNLRERMYKYMYV